MEQIIAKAAAHRRTVRVAPYVLALTGDERRADLDLIVKYAEESGWQVTRTTFADMAQSPAITRRPGFGAACRYAAQGYAHGILAIARPAITTDNDAYAAVLEHLHVRGLFLGYLPAADTTP
ncbi:hypothetical protein A6P39_000145 [Streptomyces sp. FXJ1.172]|uniref:hypothetical protein n=1 Tax=Streptomyces sp. FXJ1.172 TaxID=710705 RepID=UPI0007CF298D|nr:hypothetical protein [Streptomyces sp. FXJ1.172]WEO92669.1 hypothetical protein A6P39_000145 [Streptomyces sp. FXJ1.172]